MNMGRADHGCLAGEEELHSLPEIARMLRVAVSALLGCRDARAVAFDWPLGGDAGY